MILNLVNDSPPEQNLAGLIHPPDLREFLKCFFRDSPREMNATQILPSLAAIAQKFFGG